ncbi:MAG: hypothetical protein ACLR3C_00085 [Eggerthella lenta]
MPTRRSRTTSPGGQPGRHRAEEAPEQVGRSIDDRFADTVNLISQGAVEERGLRDGRAA